MLRSFALGGGADELWAYVCPSSGGGGTAELPRFDIAEAAKTLKLPSPQVQTFGPDRLERYVLK
ncbi:MAG: hypothetical protein MUP47_03460 [Phycisphaerae bacterium]|nr:hypothetical protein [Phycisphaerae bacterium]